MNTVEVKNLTKTFGAFVAVDDISFTLKKGEILGLLGPNGAGKTTTLQMLLGVLKPTSGSIFFFGKDMEKERRVIAEQINFSSTYVNLPWILTVQENLNVISRLYEIENRIKRVEEVIEIFDMKEHLKKSVDALSAGQVTRLNLAKAFLNKPKVLLLDEPTASLDPEVAKYVRTFILEQRAQSGMSLIFTSHNMAEVEEVCDRVVFISQGKIIANDTPENLARTINISHVTLVLLKGLGALEIYCREQTLSLRQEGRYSIIDIAEKQIARFLNEIALRGIVFDEISIEKPTLEDYFLSRARL